MSTGVEAGLRWTGAGVMALHDGKLTMARAPGLQNLWPCRRTSVTAIRCCRRVTEE